MRLIWISTLAAMAACAVDGLDATAELMLSATDGPEEALARSDADANYTTSMPVDAPPLMRECNAEGDFVGLVALYDGDGDGAWSPPEQSDVAEAREGRPDPQQMAMEMRWHMLLMVYDLDNDQALSTDEQTTLFGDFTVRCDALQARLLETFDTDGDGELSASEEAAAQAAIEAERAAMGPPPGPPPGMGFGPPPAGSVPPPLAGFDTDGDGVWDDAELSAARADIREHIRNGDPLCPEPPAE